MKNAFTLVELSIVLVIIGLLTAGVVGGQSLIESSKINSQVAQLRGYETAFRAFQLEYDAKPGDMSTASTYWSTASNGDGDGLIERAITHETWSLNTEFNGFFIHLQLAGITKDNFGASNTIGPGGVPITKINPTSAFFVSDSATMAADWTPNMSSYKTFKNGIFMIGCSSNVPLGTLNYWDDNCSSSVMTAKQAKNIDAKLDDGLPLSGAFYGAGGQGVSATSCITGSSYDVSRSTKECIGVYAIDK